VHGLMISANYLRSTCPADHADILPVSNGVVRRSSTGDEWNISLGLPCSLAFRCFNMDPDFQFFFVVFSEMSFANCLFRIFIVTSV